MSEKAAVSSTSRPILMAVLSVLFGLALPLVVLEVLFWMLPVNGGLMAQAVNENDPVFHFAPNRTVIWSKGWDFSIVNTVKVNNAGYVNDQDYSKSEESPLLAVVGDSYIEAAMVPYAETVHGRLAGQLAPDKRVYSFAASGAPLSQYVIWAREARERYGADKLAIVVISNDFDESLADYKQGPGFHHYVRTASGDLSLRRFDYAPNPIRQFLRLSALARYMFFNVQVRERLGALLAADISVASTAHAAEDYVGNTSAKAGKKRMRDSREAVDAFLRDIVQVAGWKKENVVFLVDGIRYPEKSKSKRVAQSYFVRMRTHFLNAARAAGFEAIDLDPAFFAHYEKTKERFEFPSDAHWNGKGHAIAAQALASSATLSNF